MATAERPEFPWSIVVEIGGQYLLDRSEDCQRATQITVTGGGIRTALLLLETESVMDLDPATADRAWLFHLPANLVDQLTIMGSVPPPTADRLDGERSPWKPFRRQIQPSPCRRAQFVDLPHLPSADVEGGEEASKTAPCVDADEMAEVQHPPVNLGRVPHDNGPLGALRPWGRIDREPEGSLAVLVGEGAVRGVVGVNEEVAVGLMAEREPLEKRPTFPGEGSIPLTGSR